MRRSAAVTKISAAFDDLSAQDFPHKAALFGELKGAIDKANGYRTKADAAVKQGKAAARRRHRQEPVRVAVGTLGDVAEGLERGSVQYQPARSRTRAADQSASLAGICATWRASSARISAQAISAKAAIPPDKLAAIGDIRAQIALMWSFCKSTCSTNDLAGDEQRHAVAKDGYYGKFQPLADEMRKVSGEGAAYPMSLAAMGRHDDAAALHAARNHVRRRRSERSAYREPAYLSALALAINIGLLLVGIALAVGAMWLRCAPSSGRSAICRRRCRHGHERSLGPACRRPDEIGDMARALKSFQANGRDGDAPARSSGAAAKTNVERARKLGEIAIAEISRATIGGIVNTVSSASTELEAAATSLTKTAENTQHLSDHGGGGFGRSLRQRAVGGERDRGIVLLGA